MYSYVSSFVAQYMYNYNMSFMHTYAYYIAIYG